ncbi:uncharacterized protein ATNIH1004_009647 [Aspergillus tanneri]|uniref:Uncharacterized protein n=1 Tax=Aspergillus tanneri TaxID=1220188 RepID=A0A5M9MB46_9EURO|nr:uncharacterized protein ATNIH1004_009647 [Aspergillus tanneri]KAA8642886.1 hypothetical protein ATNIH1004_009647 [Aspergillus tanneri]
MSHIANFTMLLAAAISANVTIMKGCTPATYDCYQNGTWIVRANKDKKKATGPSTAKEREHINKKNVAWKANTTFFENLAPLKELQLHPREEMFNIFNVVNSMVLASSDISQIGESCPRVGRLDLIINRSKGDRSETACYEVFGQFQSLNKSTFIYTTRWSRYEGLRI